MLKQSNSKQDISDKKRAMKIILDSLAVMPANENYLSLKISLLSNMEKLDDALREIDMAIQKYPNSYKFYDLQASIYRKQNRLDKAIECYKKMIKIEPSRKSSLDNLMAGAYMQLNKLDESLQIMNQLIKEYPKDNDNFLFSRSQIMMSKKDLNAAKKDLDHILSKDSTNIQYAKLLAQYYYLQGNKRLYYFQNQQIIRQLQNTYTKNKEDVNALFDIASTYTSIKDAQNAEAAYNAILALFPGNYEALKQKARIKLTNQLWADAISIYDQLENNYPPVEEFYNNKAIAYIQTGNYNKALEYFNKTIDLNPNNKDARFNRDRLKAEMGGQR